MSRQHAVFKEIKPSDMNNLKQVFGQLSNTGYTRLDVYQSDVKFSHEVCDALAQELRTNSKLTHLSLNGVLDDYGISKIAQALQDNKTLTHLYLDGNAIDAEGVKQIALMLQKNQNLKTLSVSFSRLRDGWIDDLHNGVVANKSLTNLRLLESCSLKGAQKITAALIKNTTLEELSINRIYGYHPTKLDPHRLYSDGKPKPLKVPSELSECDQDDNFCFPQERSLMKVMLMVRERIMARENKRIINEDDLLPEVKLSQTVLSPSEIEQVEEMVKTFLPVITVEDCAEEDREVERIFAEGRRDQVAGDVVRSQRSAPVSRQGEASGALAASAHSSTSPRTGSSVSIPGRSSAVTQALLKSDNIQKRSTPI